MLGAVASPTYLRGSRSASGDYGLVSGRLTSAEPGLTL